MTRFSILIPVFNEDISALCADLGKLETDSKGEIEFIFGDDASINEEVQNHNHQFIRNLKDSRFQYIIRESNLGYCENRNLLGSQAKGDYLIFLDADVRIENPRFLQNWIENAKKGLFLCGGNYYTKDKPKDSTKILKWKYGKLREEASLEFRQKNPHLKFWASNFMVGKELFLKFPFDRKSKSYGYNDTVYAYNLMKNDIAIEHFENPVLNTGLLTSDEFLVRSEKAVKNLVFFESQDYVEKDFKQFIKLLSFYYSLKKLGLIPIVYWKLKFFKNFLLRNLKSQKPNLRFLDLLKLYYLIQAKRA